MVPTFLPSLEVSVDDNTGNVRAAYLRVRQGEVAETREISEGLAFADYAEGGLLLGIELLGPCTLDVLEAISAQEPDPIKQFLRDSAPRELVSA